MTIQKTWETTLFVLGNLLTVILGGVVGLVLARSFSVFANPDTNETAGIGFGVLVAMLMLGRWRRDR